MGDTFKTTFEYYPLLWRQVSHSACSFMLGISNETARSVVVNMKSHNYEYYEDWKATWLSYICEPNKM